MNPLKILFFSCFTAATNKQHSKSYSVWHALASSAYVFTLCFLTLIILTADLTGNSDFLFGKVDRLKPIIIALFFGGTLVFYCFFVRAGNLEKGINQYDKFKYKHYSAVIFVSSLIVVSLITLIVAILG